MLSFAQFERELISERTRDKMAAARRKGKWLGGVPVLGYGVDRRARRLIVLPLVIHDFEGRQDDLGTIGRADSSIRPNVAWGLAPEQGNSGGWTKRPGR